MKTEQPAGLRPQPGGVGLSVFREGSERAEAPAGGFVFRDETAEDLAGGGRSSMSAAICPISSSPSSRSPSKIPRFGRPRPIRADNSSASAPRDSASSTVRQKPLRTRRVGITFLSVRIVPPSCTSTHRRLNASQAELSRDSESASLTGILRRPGRKRPACRPPWRCLPRR